MTNGVLFVPTDKEREQVEAMSGYGLPHDNIAVLIRDGIDSDTLKKHFKKELMSGKAKANAKVGQTLFQKATEGDTTAMIWWSKTQMKWAETQKIAVDLSGQVAIQHKIVGVAVKAKE
tara:strand:- start:123 stop:476 length:354 start_codon:yes stop_codon:yes gene_type:complete